MSVAGPLKEPPYQFAAAADVIRSSQKDQYYTSVLCSQVEAVARRVFNARTLNTKSDELRTSTNFLYLALTTLIGQRTLGEEFCDLTYCTSDGLCIPSIRRRTAFVTSTALLPYILSRSWPRVKRRLLRHYTESARMKRWIDTASPYLTYNNLEALHLSLFYFTGAYYTISRRVSGLRYIFTRRIDDNPERIGYEVLGCLMIARLVLPVFSDLYTKVHHQEASMIATATQVNLEDANQMPFLVDEARKCTLCLSDMQDPTATPCGHMFCWACIGEWTRSKVRLITYME